MDKNNTNKSKFKILVCTDGSEQSYKAAEEAARIAAPIPEAEVLVLHAYSNIYTPMPVPLSPVAPVGVMDKDLKQIEKEGSGYLEEAAGHFEEKGIKVKKVLKYGHTVTAITEVASEEDVDLIVVGNSGKGGLEKMVLGSVSNAIVQASDNNVLVVK